MAVLPYLSLDHLNVTAEFKTRTDTYKIKNVTYTKTIPYWLITYSNGDVRECHDSLFTRNYLPRS